MSVPGEGTTRPLSHLEILFCQKPNLFANSDWFS